jgi:hypothetical protein
VTAAIDLAQPVEDLHRVPSAEIVRLLDAEPGQHAGHRRPDVRKLA